MFLLLSGVLFGNYLVFSMLLMLLVPTGGGQEHISLHSVIEVRILVYTMLTIPYN